MRLSAPKQITFLISLIIAIIGVLAKWVITIPVVTEYATGVILVAFALLALGTYVKGL
jgi:hypothetical protein